MAKKTAAKVIDLMEALKKSLEDAKRHEAERTPAAPTTDEVPRG